MVNKEYKKINCDEIKFGIRYSAPVFFDDGENMFLAEGKSVKAYHIAALKRWGIPFLLSYGHVLDTNSTSKDEDFDDIEELEELEDLEEID